MCLFAGRKLGFTFDNQNFHNVSLGQGQEIIAEQALSLAAKNGHWVILQVSHSPKQKYISIVFNMMLIEAVECIKPTPALTDQCNQSLNAYFILQHQTR